MRGGVDSGSGVVSVTYSMASSGAVIRSSDGATIPNDAANVDRAAYDEWLAEGGVPDPAPSPDPAQAFIAAATALIEGAATGMGYTNASYCEGWRSSSIPQYAAEAAAFFAWRDAVWIAIGSLDPANPPESVAAALALLPVFVRPI